MISPLMPPTTRAKKESKDQWRRSVVVRPDSRRVAPTAMKPEFTERDLATPTGQPAQSQETMAMAAPPASSESATGGKKIVMTSVSTVKTAFRRNASAWSLCRVSERSQSITPSEWWS